MLRKFLVTAAWIFAALPLLITAAPGSIYGKALQNARNVSNQAAARHAVPADKKPEPAKNRVSAAGLKQFSRKIAAAKLKKYPRSGAVGINVLLAKKIIDPVLLGLPEGTVKVSEKDLQVAWFGSEAAKVKKRERFPLFCTKPACGALVVGFTDGTVVTLKQRPRTVTGAVTILRASSANKKSSLWNAYLKTARHIDKSSR